MKLPSVFHRKPKETSSKTDAKKNSPEKGSKHPGKIVSKSGVPSTVPNSQLKRLISSQIAASESSDYVVIKIHKQSVLIVLGVAVITMWTIPLVQQVNWKSIGAQSSEQAKSLWQQMPWNRSEEAADDSPEASSSANPNADATESAQLDRSYIRIRIRTSDPTPPISQDLDEILRQLRYQVIDIVTDSTQTYSGLQLAVKPDQPLIRERILQDLQGMDYAVTSASAELTADSDFDAVIMVGN